MVKTAPYGIYVVREVTPCQGNYPFERLVG